MVLLQSSELTVGGDELISDADTEEALAEFDFLVSVSRDGAGEARSQADTDWGKAIVPLTVHGIGRCASL